MEVAPKIVQKEFGLKEVQVPDCRIVVPSGHIAIYVRRISGIGRSYLVGWIAALVVEPKQRKQGIGSYLVEDSKLWLFTHCIRYAALHCEPELVEFYKKLDFRVTPNVPGPGVAMAAITNRGYGCPSFPVHPITFREPW